MTPQLEYSLKKAAIMVGIAAAGAFAGQLTDIFKSSGIDPIWLPVAGGAVAGLVRTFEGWRDGLRAEKGQTIPEDVTATMAREGVK
jgi:C4-dicarboxylate transporter